MSEPIKIIIGKQGLKVAFEAVCTISQMLNKPKDQKGVIYIGERKGKINFRSVMKKQLEKVSTE